ncbi:MAG: hypothetical protein KGL39_06665 [Patescibacteria group bacterium]|nr:hypothetical protein [Patescibacteria group bacterium]
MIHWATTRVRETGTCPMGHPRIAPSVLEAEKRIRPRALLLDSGWWGEYSQEWGDTAFLMYDAYLDAGKPSERHVTLICCLTVGMYDSEMLARAEWLFERRAFYSWVYPPQLSKLRMCAAEVANQDVQFSN